MAHSGELALEGAVDLS